MYFYDVWPQNEASSQAPRAEPFIEENNVAKEIQSCLPSVKKSKYLAINVARWHTFSLFASDQSDIEFVKTPLAGRKTMEGRFRS